MNETIIAFPRTAFEGRHKDIVPDYIEGNKDMSLRDLFAGMALIGLIINPKTINPECPLTVRAYEIADVMLEERGR